MYKTTTVCDGCGDTKDIADKGEPSRIPSKEELIGVPAGWIDAGDLGHLCATCAGKIRALFDTWRKQ